MYRVVATQTAPAPTRAARCLNPRAEDVINQSTISTVFRAPHAPDVVARARDRDLNAARALRARERGTNARVVDEFDAIRITMRRERQRCARQRMRARARCVDAHRRPRARRATRCVTIDPRIASRGVRDARGVERVDEL